MSDAPAPAARRGQLGDLAQDLAALVGAALIVAGVALLSRPAALIVAGGFLLGAAWISARKG